MSQDGMVSVRHSEKYSGGSTLKVAHKELGEHNPLGIMHLDSANQIESINRYWLDSENLGSVASAIYALYPDIPFGKEFAKALKLDTNPDADHGRILAERLSKNKADQLELVNTATPPRDTRPDDRSAHAVLQGQFQITTRQDSKSALLKTFGAGPCVVLTLYDPKTGTGAMAHFDALKNVPSSMGTIISALQSSGVDTASLQARIIGGQTGGSERLVLDLRNSLSQRNVPIVEQDILGHDVRSIMLDTKTGEVFDYVETGRGLTPQEEVGLLGAVNSPVIVRVPTAR